MEDLKEVNTVAAIYKTHDQAEAAVSTAAKQGADMKNLSIIGRGYHSEEKVVGYYHTKDRMLAWGQAGAFWGGLWGLLVGAGFFFVPGVGPVVIAGPLIATLVGTVEGAVVGSAVSALAAGLVSLGIPKDSAIKYESAVKADEFLVVYQGESIEDAMKIKKCLEELDLHAALDLYPAP